MERRLALAAWVMLAAVTPLAAQEPPADGAAAPSLSLRTSFKATALVSRGPDAPILFPQRTVGMSFWRVRLEPQARVAEGISVAAAYEHRLRLFSAAAGAGTLSVLPPETPAPYRVRQLDWQIDRSSHSTWRHEVDRAYLAVHRGRAAVTVGRQAVGWGRGVLFGAVDLFSPFSPLEADREWRRGVDAIRADVALADRVSCDVVGAFGDRLDASIVAARLRGYAGPVDIELVGGRRARDLFTGITSSAAVGNAEVHGELGVFRAPEALAAGGLSRDGRVAIKAVAGGSYRFPLGHGVLVYAEYHYSGFGAAHAADVLPLLATTDFRDRYLRGDTQILGRHAMAVLASHEFSPSLAMTGQWLHSPADGSGVVAPTATITFGDSVSLVAAVYVPYGRAPEGRVLRSEYGAGAFSALVQARLYR